MTSGRRIVRRGDVTRARRSFRGASGVVLVLLACEPTNWTHRDEFPAQLARGCSSKTECRALMDAALDRVADCREVWPPTIRRQSVAGTQVLACEREAVSDDPRCSYAVEDFKLAFAKAKAWDNRRSGIPPLEGDHRYLPQAQR